MVGEESFYELLEITANATFEEIESSYQRIISYLDASSLAIYSMVEEEEVVTKRSAVDEAYRTLSDPDRRAAYDRAISENDSYPPVVVPESPDRSSVTVGHVGVSPRDVEPPKQFRSSVDGPAPAPAAHTPTEPSASPTDRPARPETPRARPAPAPPVAKKRVVTRLVPSLEIDISDDTEFSGSLLRRLRESADATIDDVAEVTKINKRYLKALEENDFAALPAAVYVRGFVSEYARALGLDPRQVARSYMALFERYKGEGG